MDTCPWYGHRHPPTLPAHTSPVEGTRERFKAFLLPSFCPSPRYPPTISFTRAKKHAYNTTNEYNSLAATVTPYRFALCYRSIIPTRFHLSHPALFTRRTTVNPSFSLSAPSPDTTLEQLRSRFLSTDPVPESGATTHARTHEGGFGGYLWRSRARSSLGGRRRMQGVLSKYLPFPRREAETSGLRVVGIARVARHTHARWRVLPLVADERDNRTPLSPGSGLSSSVARCRFCAVSTCYAMFSSRFFLLFYEKDLVLFNLDMAIWN